MSNDAFCWFESKMEFINKRWKWSNSVQKSKLKGKFECNYSKYSLGTIILTVNMTTFPLLQTFGLT